MQSWNSKGMEGINEVKVKAPGVEREESQEVLRTMGTKILVRSFNLGTAWTGLRSETVEDMRVELQRWTAERFGQFHGQGQEVTNCLTPSGKREGLLCFDSALGIHS